MTKWRDNNDKKACFQDFGAKFATNFQKNRTGRNLPYLCFYEKNVFSTGFEPYRSRCPAAFECGGCDRRGVGDFRKGAFRAGFRIEPIVFQDV